MAGERQVDVRSLRGAILPCLTLRDKSFVWCGVTRWTRSLLYQRCCRASCRGMTSGAAVVALSRSDVGSFRRSSPGWWRGERGDRLPRVSSRHHQAPQSAPIVDGLVSHVTVTDRRHALCGQRLPLVPVRSGRGPAYIVVELPDGRRRSLRRLVTDLAGAADATPTAEREPPRISARTLLPLARHVAAGLAARVMEVPHADQSPFVANPAVREGDSASTMAEPAGRDANAGRPAPGRPAATADADPPCGDGDRPC
jgi:hypothetical protein